jgi:PIN domain nuclease of toxin-antitoxin system
MSEAVLLDTCAAIWWTAGSALTAKARRRIEHAAKSDCVFISPITAWEVANLGARGRSPIRLSALDWYYRTLALAGFHEALLDAEILTASCEVTGLPHGDPADRILVATARKLRVVLVTRDMGILDYGRTGHVRVMEC